MFLIVHVEIKVFIEYEIIEKLWSIYMTSSGTSNSTTIGTTTTGQDPFIIENLSNSTNIGWQFNKLIALNNSDI